MVQIHTALLALSLAAQLGSADSPTPPGGPRHGEQKTAAPLAMVCGLPVPAPAALPPAGSPPVLLALLLCFEKQGGMSLIEPQTYLHHIRARPSEPSRGRWVTYDEDVRTVLLDDFQRLWNTRFLDDLSIEVLDHPLENGVVAKVAVFNIEERQRVKIVRYEGATKFTQTDIENELAKREIGIRLDSFVDIGTLRVVSEAIRDLYGTRGFSFAEVKPAVTEIASGRKLVNVTFTITEGPRVAIRDVEFLGNNAIDDEKLAKAMKANRAQGLLSIVKGTGTYQAEKYEEDVDAVVALYRDHGYIDAKVGEAELRPLDDSADGRTRWVQLRIPVEEGTRSTVGTLAFEGNTKVASDILAALFPLRSGDVYNEGAIRKGLEKAREVYGAAGYFEFTGYPDLQPREGPGIDDAETGDRPPGTDRLPVVDVTVRVQEGQQYFVNRITFAGNTYTRDEVIRREIALVEQGVFNTESLKYSLRRLNQLGYFKPLDENAVTVEKAAGSENRVDIELKVEEQNRNQIQFGAGASEYEGFFGNASFSTSNFLGHGESVTLTAQRGSRATYYQAGFTRPFLFGRPITAGFSLFTRKIDYQLYSARTDYSEARNGATATVGLTLRRFTRLFAAYGYEIVDTAASSAVEAALAGGSLNLYLQDGQYVQSSVSPSLIYDSVDNPYAPRKGLRLTATYQYAGGILGGTTNFIRPDLEAIAYLPLTRRTALGFRAGTGWIRNYSSTPLPYYLRYFLGGETQIRGTDIRTVGPMNENDVALGGSKFLLFNVEAYYDIVPQVRALLFHDAGQAFAEDDPMDFRKLRTSSGAEVRVTLPMINVPFRLIYAWNVYRDTFQPARTFRFAVGTTF